MIDALKLILAFNLIICCSSQPKNQSSFDCSLYKQFSKKSDLSVFTVAGLDFKSINPEAFKSVSEYPLLKNVLPEEEVYFYSHLEDNCSLILLSKSELDGKSIKLYLVSLSDTGEVNGKVLLADKSAYPGSFSETRSQIEGDKLTVTKIDSYVGDYIEEEDRYTTIIDSVTIRYIPSDVFYKQIFKDSVRLEK